MNNNIKEIKEIKYYSHDWYVPSHNHCPNDHGNHTYDGAGYDRIPDLWHHETDVYLYATPSFSYKSNSYQFKISVNSS